MALSARSALIDPSGQQEVVRNQKLSDTVGLYGDFLYTRESRQFCRGKGHRSKSLNTKTETNR